MKWPWPTLPGLDSYVLDSDEMAMTHIVFLAKSNNIHLPFKDLGSIGRSIGHPYGFKGIYIKFFEDRCKDSKGVDGILKESYKDFSWNSIGFP